MTTRPPLAVAITAQQPLWTFSWELTNSKLHIPSNCSAYDTLCDLKERTPLSKMDYGSIHSLHRETTKKLRQE